MSKKSFKGWLIASGAFAVAGIICIIVKLVELTMRTEHAWAQTFLIVGLVLVAIAVLMLLGVTIASGVIEKKNEGKAEVTDEELLAKYKSKKNR